ncbi:MAG: NAD(P)/FAD-dependent oxidoreductase [Clostridiales bacterium]|nr:NAD(P)/FAD-dependent oxidoreductase [Clostridiales bacterium]
MQVAIIGGGAAGQMAAIEAAKNGHAVTLFERNEKLGRKIYITGKGRCNLTNLCTRDEFFANIARNPRFLYSAFAAFAPEDIIALVEGEGIPTKAERGRRVFPASDKASDVLKALSRALARHDVKICYNTRVTALHCVGGAVTAIETEAGTQDFDAVILCTGGASYPQTGSTGDGYALAAVCGHTVIPPAPSLVPLETEEGWCGELTGLTLKNVTLSAEQGGKTVFSEQGELLFTHFGVSGPLVLSCSARMQAPMAGARLYIDLKPALSRETLDARILRELAENHKKGIAAALRSLLPERFLACILAIAGIDPAHRAAEMTKQERTTLINTLKAVPLTVRATRPLDEAIVTRGGIATTEVNPKTMESRLIRNLYFAGEILDVDAFTGGYNLQIAWSTGVLAGRSVGG